MLNYVTISFWYPDSKSDIGMLVAMTLDIGPTEVGGQRLNHLIIYDEAQSCGLLRRGFIIYPTNDLKFSEFVDETDVRAGLLFVFGLLAFYSGLVNRSRLLRHLLTPGQGDEVLR